MPNLAFEIFAIFLLLVANGLFSMSEIALVTARKSRLQSLAEQGVTRARQALELASHPNRFLSTVQIGITLVGILAGAFGGGQLTEWLAAQLAGIPLLANYARTIALAIVVICLTYFSVFIGELVPKRLALGHPETIAMFMAPLMRLLLVLCGPIVHLFTVSTTWFSDSLARDSIKRISSPKRRLRLYFGKEPQPVCLKRERQR